MSTKKVLIIGEAFYPEDFLINDLVTEWEQEKYAVEVLTRAPSYPFGKVYSGYKNKIYQVTYFNSIKVHRFPVVQGYQKSLFLKLFNYISFAFWSFWVVLFIGKRFDKVFIYQTGPLTLAFAGIILKKLYKAEVIIWTQDLWPESVYAYGFKKTKALRYCLNHFVKWVYKNSDHILVSCEGFIERIRQHVPGREIKFVPNWSLVKYLPKNNKRLPGDFNFTFAGNVGKVQNLGNVILAFSSFVKTHPEAWLNIIGDGSFLNGLKDIVKENEIPNVNFVGRRPLQEMSDYYEASDVLIISLKDVPLYEIMIPSKFQAYLSTNKPIYAVFKGEIKNIVEKYKIGLSADPSNIEEIAEGFEKFLNLSQEDINRMAKNSKELLETVFDRDKIVGKITDVVWGNTPLE